MPLSLMPSMNMVHEQKGKDLISILFVDSVIISIRQLVDDSTHHNPAKSQYMVHNCFISLGLFAITF